MVVRRSLPIALVSLFSSLSGCGAGASPDDPGEKEASPAPRAAALARESEGERCAPMNARAGTLDANFGVSGAARVRFGADDDGGFLGLDVAADGIVAAGFGASGLGAVRFRLSRLTPAGALDPSFGERGVVVTPFAASTADDARAVAVGHQRDGGIVAIGYRARFRGESSNIALVRYAPDGSLGGAGFGDHGKSLIDLGGEEEITDGMVLPDDRILMVGSRGADLLVARASARGALDPTFARPNGYRAVHAGDAVKARAVALDAEGRILVAGTADLGGRSSVVVLRTSADGELDGSFGRGGLLVFGEEGDARAGEGGGARAVKIAPLSGGRIVVAGDVGREGARALRVWRLLESGAPDPMFGVHGDGASDPSPGGLDVAAASMVVLPGGGVLVGGNAGEGASILTRYRCDGALEEAFGAHGVVRVFFGEDGILLALDHYSRDRVLIAGADVGGTPGPGTFGVVMRMWM